MNIPFYSYHGLTIKLLTASRAVLSGGLFVFFLCAGADAREKAVVTWYGAAGRVSGSMAVVRVSSHAVMIDCGSFYAEESNDQNTEKEGSGADANAALPFPARSIDAVILTHAHLDHSGRLPLLVSRGFRGPVWCSKPTALFLGELLLSQAKFDTSARAWVYSRRGVKARDNGRPFVTAHWRGDCPWRKNISPSNTVREKGTLRDVERRTGIEISPCRSCAEQEIRPVITLLKPVALDTDIALSRGLNFHLYPTGHIPGAASVLLTAARGGERVRLFFSGDIGSRISALQAPPPPAPPADALWVETTYGGVIRAGDIGRERERFRREVGDAVRGGGIAWIPAAALDRTQKVLFELRLAREEGALPAGVPVICPSPSAKAFTGWYENELRHPGAPPWFRKELYASGRTLLPGGYTDSFRGVKKKIPRPAVLVTTSGMMDKAFSRSLVPVLLPDARTTVFLTGYQAPGTPGGALKKGAARIELDGKSFDVRAAVRVHDIFSGHGDTEDVSRLLSLQSRDAMVVLVHGEPASLIRQQQALGQRGYSRVAVEEGAVAREIPFRFDTAGGK